MWPRGTDGRAAFPNSVCSDSLNLAHWKIYITEKKTPLQDSTVLSRTGCSERRGILLSWCTLCKKIL